MKERTEHVSKLKKERGVGLKGSGSCCCKSSASDPSPAVKRKWVQLLFLLSQTQLLSIIIRFLIIIIIVSVIIVIFNLLTSQHKWMCQICIQLFICRQWAKTEICCRSSMTLNFWLFCQTWYETLWIWFCSPVVYEHRQHLGDRVAPWIVTSSSQLLETKPSSNHL